MATIFIGDDNKQLGISHNQIFTGNLPIEKGEFPPHVKEAVLANPGLENSFMAFDRYAAIRPLKTVAPPPSKVAILKGPPIKVLPGLQRK